jgi:hypothetical protein
MLEKGTGYKSVEQGHQGRQGPRGVVAPEKTKKKEGVGEEEEEDIY